MLYDKNIYLLAYKMLLNNSLNNNNIILTGKDLVNNLKLNIFECSLIYPNLIGIDKEIIDKLISEIITQIKANTYSFSNMEFLIVHNLTNNGINLVKDFLVIQALAIILEAAMLPFDSIPESERLNYEDYGVLGAGIQPRCRGRCAAPYNLKQIKVRLKGAK